jgi:hypothetical protein
MDDGKNVFVPDDQNHESGGDQIHEADGTVISPVSEIDSQTRHELG